MVGDGLEGSDVYRTLKVCIWHMEGRQVLEGMEYLTGKRRTCVRV